MSQWSKVETSHKVYVWMCAIFLTSLIIANLVGSLLFSFHVPWMKDAVLLSAGIIPFPITFILTDLINEFYGEKGARYVTFVGFAMSILVYVFLVVGEHLPVDPGSVMPMDVYTVVSSQYTGMFIASLTAYLVGQLLDIKVFHLFRSITKHRYIWLRATGSTVVSQLFDSLLVTFIAFGSQKPADFLFHLAMGNYCWKFIIAVGITPFLYLGHGLLRRLMPHQEEELVAAGEA